LGFAAKGHHGIKRKNAKFIRQQKPVGIPALLVDNRLWVVKKLSDLEMSELRRIKDSTVLPLNLAVKTLLLT